LKLRTKTIITIAVIAFLIFGALHIITTLLIDPSFNNLEIQDSKKGINQAITSLNYRLSDLQGKVKDYATWDETYNYILNRNPTYPETNFIEGTFVNLNLNLAVIINNDRDIIYCQSYDFDSSTKIQTSEQTISAIASDPTIWSYAFNKTSYSGIMLLDNQLTFVVAAPILTSLGDGPVLGGMLFGRYINEREITQLSNQMNLMVSINTLSNLRLQNDGRQIADSLLKEKETVVVKANSPTLVSGYTLINDVDSNPTFVLQVSQDRIINQQGMWVRNIFLGASLVIAVTVGAGFLFIQEREIVKPMMKLASAVEETTFDSNKSTRQKKIKSSEEIDILSEAVRTSVNKRLEGMNEVSRMVAHDLRNPLAGIKNATYFLKKHYGENLGENGNTMLKTINDCVEYSNKIVKDLLDYSCEIKLDKIKTNPNRLVKDSLSTLLIPSNVKIINEASDDLSVLVDNGKIERVFSNLIKNACDAMLSGGQLRITNRSIKNKVEVSFCDNGTGMSKEVMQKLWSPFFTTKAKGMGIGLGICKRIIEAHGGKIEVQSTEGKGTCFSVFLPQAN
jgi:signal transduction histidine kinase